MAQLADVLLSPIPKQVEKPAENPSHRVGTCATVVTYSPDQCAGGQNVG